jgi:hypothetical protein
MARAGPVLYPSSKGKPNKAFLANEAELQEWKSFLN